MKSTHLAQKQFRDAIRKGLGRAILHLKQHAAEPYLEEVIYACTNNTAYDRQCEDDRVRYLMRAAALTGRLETIRAEILNSLAISLDYGSTSQLFGLAYLFAKKGDAEARQAIYGKFDRNDAAEPFIGASAIIAIDGIDGLLHAARKVGQEVLRGTTKGDVYLVANARDYVDEHIARQSLAQAALQDSSIKAYLEASGSDEAATRSQIESGYRTGRTFAELLAELDTCGPNTSRIQWRHWARTATPEDLREVALHIEREPDPDRLFKFLSVFMGKTTYPLEPDKLVELTSSKTDKLAYRAVVVLWGMKHPRVRQHFFDLLSSRRHLGIVFGLLKNNFVPGDELLILRWVEENSSSDLSIDEVHGICLDLLGVVEANDGSDFRSIVRWVYENTPCSLCRHSALKLLVQHDAADEELLEECRYDCVDETRRLALQVFREHRRQGRRPR